jgi:hypothetical protein
MVRSVQTRWAFAASLLLLVGFVVGFAGDLVHTDDGCPIEVHCLACQRVLVSVGIAALVPPWGPSIEPLGRVTARDTIPTHDPDAPAAGSRAPPLA